MSDYREPWTWNIESHGPIPHHIWVKDCNGAFVAELTLGSEDNATLVCASHDLLHAAKEALAALTQNRDSYVMGDFNIADGYGLDDQVMWLTEAIQKAETP